MAIVSLHVAYGREINMANTHPPGPSMALLEIGGIYYTQLDIKYTCHPINNTL